MMITQLKEKLFGPKADYNELMKNGAVVIDVRTPQEFRHGHFSRSKNIPLNSLPHKVQTLMGKEVILVCKSGARAAQASNFLKQNGITSYNAGPWTSL